MLGYMTKKQALRNGFTHHASYYGIPLWMTDEEIPMVATKFAPFEFLLSLGHVVEGVMNTLQGNEPSFLFKIGQEIK